MRLCIPTVDDGGLEAKLSDHFGSAPYWTLVDGETGGVEVVRNHHEAHEHGHGHGGCHSVEALDGLGVGAVVCRGLGRRAFARLRGAGVEVLVTREETAAAALSEHRAGRLEPLTLEGACHGGGRHHGDRHHHGDRQRHGGRKHDGGGHQQGGRHQPGEGD